MKNLKLKLKSKYGLIKADAEGIGELYDRGLISTVLPKETYVANVIDKKNPIRLNIEGLGLMPGQYLVLQFDKTNFVTGCIAFENEAEVKEFFEEE